MYKQWYYNEDGEPLGYDLVYGDEYDDTVLLDEDPDAYYDKHMRKDEGSEWA